MIQITERSSTAVASKGVVYVRVPIEWACMRRSFVRIQDGPTALYQDM